MMDCYASFLKNIFYKEKACLHGSYARIKWSILDERFSLQNNKSYN